MLIDESGFFLNPLLRRTWARKGHTPILRRFGRHRDKVSVVAAISVPACRRRVGFYFHTDAKSYITAPTIAAFVSAMLGQLRGPVIILWDGGSNHKGPAIREVLACYPRLQLEALPAYSPELNPVEFVWSYVKYSQMANFVPTGLAQLDEVVQTHLQAVKESSTLLRSLWSASRLPFPKNDIT